ncbi:DNA methyltransferase 1-associated protein 1 [Fasciolopsis buskii]|uniref:DNA methyltransferase 1-associated protein 1 n=1 Tax=Fasciolopsis buskii TaxID=27845 RepID=A0A8E0VDA0_9TREM|nr:DNA methyltransferase 1-associated protein 1 [Fasciolopsis buski]
MPPLMPVDETPKYCQPKAVIGVGKVRRWKWTAFKNPARTDDLILHHWRREKSESEDPVDEYPFARYNKARGTNLSKGLRYDAAHERRRKLQLSLLYGRTKEQVEEEQTLIQELHKIEARRRERERKKQDLQKLISQADAVIQNQDFGDWASGDAVFDTTIPVGFGSGNQSTGAAVGSGSAVQRKRAAPGGSVSTTAPVSGTFYAHGGSADSSTSLASLGQIGSQSTNGNSSITTTSVTTGNNGDLAGSLGSAASSASAVLAGSFSINFPDPGKNPGVHLRSQRMKLPTNLGQKKIRIVENFLTQLQIDPSPPATAEIVELYNNLRSKILLLYDLRLVHLNCEFELQAARWRLDTFAPDQVVGLR